MAFNKRSVLGRPLTHSEMDANWDEAASKTGAETLTNKTLTAPAINDPAISKPLVTSLKEKKTAPSIAANVLTIDCALGNFFAASLNANITSFTVSNIPAAGEAYGFVLEFTADGTGRTITWSFQGVTVKWAGGTAPTPTSTNGKKDTYVFYTYDAGATWIGAIVGQNF